MARHRSTSARALPGVDLRSDTLWTGSPDGSPGLRRAFMWLTRTGIGVRSGSRPIGWVHMHNVGAIDAITEAAQKLGGDLSRVRAKDGVVYAGTTRLGSVSSFFDEADRRGRR